MAIVITVVLWALSGTGCTYVVVCNSDPTVGVATEKELAEYTRTMKELF